MMDKLTGLDYIRDALQIEERQSLRRVTEFISDEPLYEYHRGRLELARLLLGLMDYAAATEKVQKQG